MLLASNYFLLIVIFKRHVQQNYLKNNYLLKIPLALLWNINFKCGCKKCLYNWAQVFHLNTWPRLLWCKRQCWMLEQPLNTSQAACRKHFKSLVSLSFWVNTFFDINCCFCCCCWCWILWQSECWMLEQLLNTFQDECRNLFRVWYNCHIVSSRSMI